MTQVPALFKRTTRRVKQKNTITLSQPQIQSLISLMKENIQVERAMLESSTKIASNMWNNCNPDDESQDMQDNFNYLNHFKSEIRKYKSKIAKLNKLQNTLKKMR